VHARLGERDRYRPIATPLSPTSRPLDVARGLLSVFPFRTIYIADLDAIEGKGDNNATLRLLKAHLPDVDFWVDNGVADLAAAKSWLDEDIGRLVLGSETQRDENLVRRFCRDDRVILSLDYRGDAFVGPAALLGDTTVWPAKVIAMTLARVGSAMGPDLDKLMALSERGSARLIYAAGGVRDASDLAALARAGIAGALVASCLHNGSLEGEQIARLQSA